MAKYNMQSLKGQYARERDRVGRIFRHLHSDPLVGDFFYTLRGVFGNTPKEITQEDIEALRKIKNRQDLLDYIYGRSPDIDSINIPKIDIEVPEGGVVKITVEDIKWHSIQQNIVRPQLSRTMLGSFFDELPNYYSKEEIIEAIEKTELANYEMQEFDYYDEKQRHEIATALKVTLSELPDNPNKDYLENILNNAIQDMEEYVEAANRRGKRRMKNTWYNT